MILYYMESDDKRIIYKPPIIHIANDDKCSQITRVMCNMIGAFTATTYIVSDVNFKCLSNELLTLEIHE